MPRITWVIRVIQLLHWSRCYVEFSSLSFISFLFKHNAKRRKLDISVFISTQHWYQLVTNSELSSWHPTKVLYRAIHHDTIVLQYQWHSYTFEGRKLHDLFLESSENENRWLCITHTCPLIPKTSVRRPNVLKRSSEPTVKISKANKIGLEDLHSTLKLWPHSFVHPYKPVKTTTPSSS